MSTLPFVGRDWELRALRRFYEERGAAFLILYGRKRVGKTRLLRQFIQSEEIQNIFYWTAPPGTPVEQLQAFSQAVYAFGSEPLPSPDFSFFHWDDALDYLAGLIEQSESRLLVIVEGFTTLCHSTPGLSSVFQRVWDHRLQNVPRLRLVLTGAHTTTIIREVSGYSAPLYMRAQYQFYLRPLPYTALLDLWPDYSLTQRLLIYAITGGHPAYLAYFDQVSDVTDGIGELCFSPNSPLQQDVAGLFDEQLEQPDLCRAILQAVAEGYDQPLKLSQRLELPLDDIGDCLEWLRWTKLLHHHTSVHNPIHSARVRYEVAEAVVNFYYRYFLPEQALAQEQNQTIQAQAMVADLMRSLPKLATRILCQEWIWASVTLRTVGVPAGRTGAYWLQGQEAAYFPVAAADEWRKQLLLGALLSEGELTTSGLTRFVQQCQAAPTAQKEGWTLQPVIFSAASFTPAIRQAADLLGVRLVALAEIEPLLLAARERLHWEWDNPDNSEIDF